MHQTGYITALVDYAWWEGGSQYVGNPADAVPLEIARERFLRRPPVGDPAVKNQRLADAARVALTCLQNPETHDPQEAVDALTYALELEEGRIL